VKELIMPDRNFAAADIGTNSFHLIIVKAGEDGSFTIIDREREVIRLGSQTGKELNHLSKEEIGKGVGVLKRFKKLADFYKAELHAVATSAVREANNSNEFLDSALSETGINIEVIDGKKEAEYIYKGARYSLQFRDKKLLCCDIGGGSTEYILGYNEKIIFSESIKIGAVRLSKKFFPDFILTGDRIRDCSKYIEEQIRIYTGTDHNEKFDIAVGTSGTILSVAQMINFRKTRMKRESLNGFLFTKTDLDDISAEILSRATPELRINIEGIEYKRADIIPAGILILNKSFELFNIKEMIVSEYALREGVVLSLMEKEGRYLIDKKV